MGLNRLVSHLHLVLKLGVRFTVTPPPATSLHGGQTDKFNCTSRSLSKNDNLNSAEGICMETDFSRIYLTLILLTWRIWWGSNKSSDWQTGFNLVFKGLKCQSIVILVRIGQIHGCFDENLRVFNNNNNKLQLGCCPVAVVILNVYRIWNLLLIHLSRKGYIRSM